MSDRRVTPAKRRESRWWHIRLDSPLLHGAAIGWVLAVVARALLPALRSSWEERVWMDHGMPLIGLTVGALVGLLIDPRRE